MKIRAIFIILSFRSEKKIANNIHRLVISRFLWKMKYYRKFAPWCIKIVFSRFIHREIDLHWNRLYLYLSPTSNRWNLMLLNYTHWWYDFSLTIFNIYALVWTVFKFTFFNDLSYEFEHVFSAFLCRFLILMDRIRYWFDVSFGSKR